MTKVLITIHFNFDINSKEPLLEIQGGDIASQPLKQRDTENKN